MYAVIKTGGKEYKVKKDDVLSVETLKGDAGETLTFENILLIGDTDPIKIGKPNVEGANVTAEIVRQFRAKKIIVYKKKRRKGYEKRRGHRQNLTEIKIKEIVA